MGYWSSALGDTGNDYCGGRRTYSDAPTVRLVQAGLRELADKAVSGAAGIDRQLANADPGPIDGVIRPQLTTAIANAQRIGGHSCTDGKIDDWLMSALHLQPHLNPKDSTAPPAEVPNPAKGKGSGSSPPPPSTGEYFGPGNGPNAADADWGPDYGPPAPNYGPPAPKSGGAPQAPPKSSSSSGPGIGTIVVAGVLGGLALRKLVKRRRTS